MGESVKFRSHKLLTEMRGVSARMRELILLLPPKELLQRVYWMSALDSVYSEEENSSDEPDELFDSKQFLLEFVHAVWVSDEERAETRFDEKLFVELVDLTVKLQKLAFDYCWVSLSDWYKGTADSFNRKLQYAAMSKWLMLRGHRYQSMEEEFYQYVLAPHDDVFRETYGVGSVEIAKGFQELTDSARKGISNALDALESLMDSGTGGNGNQGSSCEVVEDLFGGGITNLSRHTCLPLKLLKDLSYERGEDADFFTKGEFRGTPFQTLPVRKKPLIKLGPDYHLVDPYFARDAGYRALLFNLLQRNPSYKEKFKERQKTMSEKAFSDIFKQHLAGAKIYQEIYYKDPKTKKWCENDCLVLIDDVLVLIEAKSGTDATIASPASDFKRHKSAVEDLLIKAYSQCERFFNYLTSSDEVSLYQFDGGKYKELTRIRTADYRVMIPIGLTVESFAPYESLCRLLKRTKPLLGKHEFLSMSIDDLLVLRRFFETAGQFFHYLETRQELAFEGKTGL